jgi:hypothetical protein
MANGIRCVNRKCGHLEIEHYQQKRTGFYCEVFCKKDIKNRRTISHTEDCEQADQSSLTECSGDCARYASFLEKHRSRAIISHAAVAILPNGLVIDIGS